MHSVDANLLIALDSLLRAGSVTGAAREMHISPTAMSHTLARLRAVLDDPLFVRAGNRLVPTPRAEALRGRVGHAAAEVSAVLAPTRPIDVTSRERTFTLRMSDATLIVIGPPLDALVRREAPRVLLRVVAASLADDPELDLDIGLQSGLAPDLRLQTLYRDEMVPVLRARHPLAREHLNANTLAALDRIVTLPRVQRGRGHAPPKGASGIRVAPSFFAAMWMVRDCDAVTFVPRRFAELTVRELGLRVMDVDGPRARFTVAQAWHSRFDRDAAHVWLRRALKRVVEDARASGSKR